MAKMDDRMELIGSAIIGQAKQEARELIEKANAVRDKEIASYKDEIVNGMFDTVQSRTNNLRLRTVKSISESKLQAHRDLLLHRTEKTGAIMDSVRARLIEYSETDKYKENLLKLAGELKDKYDHNESVVMVAQRDLPLAGEIVGLLGGGTAKADSGIKLGGFKLLNKKAHILIDHTLDERLDEEKTWLLENCGFKIL